MSAAAIPTLHLMCFCMLNVCLLCLLCWLQGCKMQQQHPAMPCYWQGVRLRSHGWDTGRQNATHMLKVCSCSESLLVSLPFMPFLSSNAALCARLTWVLQLAEAQCKHQSHTAQATAVNRPKHIADGEPTWRPFCLLRAGVAPVAPLLRGPFTLLAFQVPFSAQKAY